VSLRYFNVFGPRQTTITVRRCHPAIHPAILHDQSPVIFGDGKQTRDFSHVENVIMRKRPRLRSAEGSARAVVQYRCGGRISLLDLSIP